MLIEMIDALIGLVLRHLAEHGLNFLLRPHDMFCLIHDTPPLLSAWVVLPPNAALYLPLQAEATQAQRCKRLFG
jgi:hypothetical protein